MIDNSNDGDYNNHKSIPNKFNVFDVQVDIRLNYVNCWIITLFIWEMMVPKWYDNHTSLVISDTQTISTIVQILNLHWCLIIVELVIVYDIILDEIDTPIAIHDAQNLSETICVSIFALQFCFDEVWAPHRIK